jgi:ureidoacrylate peracid hydrolase
MLKLDAKPEPVEIDLAKSAVVVVDMQNAFASKNGMLDIAGVDISGAPRLSEASLPCWKRRAGRACR